MASSSARQGQKGGKKQPSKKAKASTAPANIPPPTEEEREEMRPNGVNGHGAAKVKVEDKMDESQLNRLATGVTVDTGGATATAVSLCVPIEELRLCSPPL